MSDLPKLIIGNKNYSSWSLRPWLVLSQLGIAFEEKRLALDTPSFASEVGRYGGAGRVPVLRVGETSIWDSMAICEYVAETWPERGAWPADSMARARARSMSAEMHSGFERLRTDMPMNCRRTVRGFEPPPGAQADIARILDLWSECRASAGAGAAGPFLFGRFSVADAMYAPVASRFSTYGVDGGPVANAYVSTVLSLPAMRAWYADAAREPEVIEHEEVPDR